MSTNRADIYTLAKFGDFETFKKCFKIENINDKSETGTGLLHYLISAFKVDISVFLIENGFDVNMTDSLGQTTLHYICNYQNIALAKLILEYGGDINIRDNYGNTALWTAVFNCKGRNYEMVELFMKYKPDINTKNKAGRSPLDFAIQAGNEKLIKILKYK